MKFGKQSFRLVFLLMSLIYCNINNPYIFAEEWRFHPSFDRTPLRIIDTPDNTYFLVHQQIYNKNLIGYDFPSLTLFKFDKNDPLSGITPLVHDVALSSADIRLADYSPKGDYLIIVYNDGGVDLIDKNNELTYVDKLKKYSVPGMDIVNSVTFEPSTGDAWVATDAGYMHINASSFTVEDIQVLGKAITAIGRFSNRTVALADNSAWMATTDKLVEFSEFSKIANITSPSVLMPLSENCFGYIQGAPGTTRPLMVATYSGDAWKTKQLGSDNFYSLVANESLVSRYESNFIPNRDGFLCFSSSKAWQLKAPADGEEASAFSITLDQSPLTLGSWDFNNFWAYRDRGTFVPRHATYSAGSSSASATWTDTSDPIRPNAPAAFICTHMSYSPTYGMLAMNHGYEMFFNGNNSPTNPPLLSGLSVNNWKIYSHAYEMPLELDETQQKLYKSNVNRFPIPDPNGLLIDPIYPDWIVCGSMFGGIMFQDLSDITKNTVCFCAENNRFIGMDYFVGLTPAKSWDALSCFAPPVVDSSGNIWSVYSNAFSGFDQLQLKFVTPKDRESFYKNELGLEAKEKWHTINVPFWKDVYWTCKLLTLSHDQNEDKIVIAAAPYDPIIIYDHKKSLDDTSDDEFEIVKEIRLFSGLKIKFDGIVDIMENPVTGEILICDSKNIIIFHPKDKISEGEYAGRILAIKSGANGQTLQNKVFVNKFIFDKDGNIWLATANEGVIVVSLSSGEIIARYNMDNSKLKSNTVYGLGFNEDNHSVMISTREGIMELFYDCTGLNNEKSIAVIPGRVLPNYNGNLYLRNLNNTNVIYIKDKNGKVVRILNCNGSSQVEWDLLDKYKNKVKSGIYYVTDGYSAPVEVMIQ